MVILTGDTFYHGQKLCSAVYDLVSMQHGNVGFLLILNGDIHRVRNLEAILVPGHSEEAFCLLKSLEIHGMVLRGYQYALEVRHLVAEVLTSCTGSSLSLFFARIGKDHKQRNS